jgi:hypothetical protein
MLRSWFLLVVLCSPVTVTIAITFDASAHSVALEDAPPPGWTVSNISNSGAWDSRNQKVKWGIFFAGSIPGAVSYQATPPTSERGSKTFAGAISFNGTSQPIDGEGAISNQALVIADIPDATIPTGTAYTGPAPTLFIGAPPITWSLVSGPNDMTIDPATGVVSWPNPTTQGSPFTVTIRATDGSSNTDDETWRLYALAPPVIVPIGNQTARSGESYIGPRPQLAQGSPPVTWSLLTGPNDMIIDSSTGIVSWSNATMDGSPYTVTIAATNAVGSDDATWQLTVTEPPIIEDIPDANIPEGVPYTGPDAFGAAGDVDARHRTDGHDDRQRHRRGDLADPARVRTTLHRHHQGDGHQGEQHRDLAADRRGVLYGHGDG